MYDPQIGRWQVPDPLNEYEYNYALDKELSEEDQLNDIRNDKEAMEDVKKPINKFLRYLGPVNLTAENSAIHYSESPYAYVMDNPLNYIDPLGLDSAKPLAPVTVVGQKKNNNGNGVPSWLGPALIGLGWKFDFIKPVGMLGSTPGSSIASKVLGKAISLRFTKALGKKLGTQIPKKVGTNVIGRFLGRAVPCVGLALTLYDVNTTLVNKTFEMTPSADERESLLNGYSMSF